jgi:hypothetical protein
MIFLKNIKNELHILDTIIQKRIVGEYTYIMAIGLSKHNVSTSPKVYNEFCGKFKWDEDEEMTIGFYSNQHDPDEWLNKCIESEIVEEEFFPLDESDYSVIKEMSSKLWNEYITFDNNSEERRINSNYIEKLTEEKGGIANNYYEIFPPQGFFWTDDWNPEIVGYFSRIKDVWGLDYSVHEYF